MKILSINQTKFFIIGTALLFLLSCSDRQREYYDNGNLMSDTYYKRSRLNGLIRMFYEDGKIQELSNYKNGKLHGFKIIYFPNGRINWYCSYINGKENGIFKEYYQNNNIKSFFEYKDGLQHGCSYFYNEAGKLQQCTEYYEGKEKGNFFEYFTSGILKMYAILDTIPLYYIKFNEKFEVIDEYRFVQIKWLKDTIKLGDEAKANIKIFGPKVKTYKIATILYDIDSEPKIFDIGQNEFFYKNKPDKKGGVFTPRDCSG